MKMNRQFPHLKSTNKLLEVMEAQRNQTDSAIRKTLRQKIIEKYLDPDSGLLDKLLSCGLLTWKEFDDIRTTGSQSSKNEKLLNVILSRDMYQQFLKLLNETQHSHLVDYQSDSDYYRRLVRGDVPLTRKEETILDMNREVIIEAITDSTQLAEQLHSQGVLNDKQLQRISSTSSTIEKTEMLFDVIRKRSLKDFETTIRCLRATHQSHIACILEGGVTGRVTCRFESGTEPVNEDAIVSEFLNEFSDREYQMDGFESNLRLLGLGLSYVRRSNGIVLYFHFRSLEELQVLRTEYNSGTLRQKVEEDVSDFTTISSDKMKLTVEWPDHDYQRCALYFTLVPSTTVNDLPLEVLDMILQRTIQFIKLLGDEANDSTYVEKLFSLASVSYCWSQRLRKSVLKKAVHRNYNVEIQKVEKRSAILRNNREYLVSEIKSNDLIPQLVQSGCLVEKESSFLRRFPNNTDKNSELLRIARTFSSQRHFQFVECLYLTNQLNAARVVEEGGGTVKLCIKNEATSDISALEKHLVGKLQKLLRENIDVKLWPHKLFNTFSIYDIVILRAQQGRGVVELWLWCQSQESLERLRDIDQGELIKITEQLFSKYQPSTFVKPKTAFIDSSYFEYDVVVRNLSAKLRGNLLCPYGQRRTGWFLVCSLQDKIYAMSDRTMIHIYEDKAPYKPLEHKKLLPPSRVLNPMELLACPVQKCLYIADLAEGCIWKMSPVDDHQLRKWLPERVSKLSLSSDGKVLILDYDRENSKISIYTQEAELEIVVPVHGDSDTRFPSVAVELMPGVVAVQYDKWDSTSKGIVIMRLNATGDVLRVVETTRIFSLAPYSPGRLIAADQESKQVIVLDSQLKPLQVLLSSDTRKSPWPLFFCYRADTRELIVNHCSSSFNQFNVYKLSYDDEC